jgi:hypothetical protein
VKEGEDSVSERLVMEFKKLGYVGTAGGHIKIRHVGAVKFGFDIQKVTPEKERDHKREDDKRRRLAESLSVEANRSAPKTTGIYRFLVPRVANPPAEPQEQKEKEVDLEEVAKLLFPKKQKGKFTPPKPAGEPKQQEEAPLAAEVPTVRGTRNRDAEDEEEDENQMMDEPGLFRAGAGL